jgi:DNA-binding transcriptional ArsR family regulator
MLNNSTALLDRTFSALADPTRRAILLRLSSGEATVHELARPFPISAPAISRHLRVLESAGLIARRRDAQRLHCRLEPQSLKTATEWLEFYRSFWNDSFDRLAEHLKTTERERKRNGKRKAKRS